MNWETYSRMTKAQQDEWNFRFKDREMRFHTTKTTWAALAGIFLLQSLLVLIAVIYLSPSLGKLKPTSGILLENAAAISEMFIVLIFSGVILENCGYLYNIVTEILWRRKHKVKFIRGWGWWWKNAASTEGQHTKE